MKTMKFRVNNSQHSAAIQTKLFELGYMWSMVSKTPKHMDKPYLFATDKGSITHGDNWSYFKNQGFTEYTLEDLLKENKSMIFTIKSPQHSSVIQKRLFELGYSWMGIKIVAHVNKPFICANNGMLTYVDDKYCPYPDAVKTTLDDLYEVVEVEKIGDYVVGFGKDKITVGCVDISLQQIERIYNKLKSDVASNL